MCGAMRRPDPTLRAIAEKSGEKCGLDAASVDFRLRRAQSPLLKPGYSFSLVTIQFLD
jgi:hypothetical protein